MPARTVRFQLEEKGRAFATPQGKLLRTPVNDQPPEANNRVLSGRTIAIIAGPFDCRCACCHCGFQLDASAHEDTIPTLDATSQEQCSEAGQAFVQGKPACPRGISNTQYAWDACRRPCGCLLLRCRL